MTESELKNAPRLYVDTPLHQGQTVPLDDGQAHYLRSVLRLVPGDAVRLFNGRDGEWRATIAAIDKRGVSLALQARTREQPAAPRPVHVLFAPIKKHRLDFLVEKAVELGATHLHPVTTRRTESRHWHDDRIARQVAEAAEQCERLDLPSCAPLRPLDAVLRAMGETPVFACLERADAPALARAAAGKTGPLAILVGPEGGFSDEEMRFLTVLPGIVPVTLGPRILRSETAVCCALALLNG